MKKLIAYIFLSLLAYSGFAQKILGEQGRLLTTHNLYVDSPLYKINDSTIGSTGGEGLWKKSLIPPTVYMDSNVVTIYNDTVGITAGGSPALIVENRAIPSAGNQKNTPSVQIKTSGYDGTGSGSVYPIIWNIYATGTSPSVLTFSPTLKGITNPSPFTVNSSGNMTFNSMSGNTVTATTFTGTDFNINRKIVGTYALGNGVTSDAQWLDISPTSTYSLTTGYRTYRGIYYHPVLTTTIGAGMVAFENTLAENRFNSAGGRTGVGVPDSVNKSAKFEIRDSTKGTLITRMTKVQRNKIISSLKGTISNGGSGYFNANRGSISLTGGSGTGATADIIVSGNIVTTVWIRDIGSGYVVGDVLSATIPGGGSGFTYTITEANPPADGLLVEVTGETGGTYLSQYNASTSGWVKFTTTSD